MAREDRRWTLEEASAFVHALQSNFKLHQVPYGIGLTGSVLLGWKQSSDKDLDIILYPMSTATANIQVAKDALVAFGLQLLYDREVVVARWRRLGSKDEKHVEVFAFGHKRVDVFFLT